MAAQHDPNEVTKQIQGEILRALNEVQGACSQAAEHIDKADSLGAFGTITGLGSRLNYATQLLNLLRRWEEITKS